MLFQFRFEAIVTEKTICWYELPQSQNACVKQHYFKLKIGLL